MPTVTALPVAEARIEIIRSREREEFFLGRLKKIGDREHWMVLQMDLEPLTSTFLKWL